MKLLKPNGYNSGIDVVRFIAFLLVFVHHFVYRGGNSISSAGSSYWADKNINAFAFFGAEGVTIFFCLSGYLLSRLLIKELSDRGTLSVRSFYLRRILRIWPLYYAFIGLCLLLSSQLGNQAIEASELPTLLTFTYNWQQIYVQDSRGMAAILWSISVEEQIYLILPLLLILFNKIGIRKLPILLIILGNLFRILFYIYDLQIYRNTFSYLSTIGIGMFFAINEKEIRLWCAKRKQIVNLFLVLLVTTYVLVFESFFSNGPLVVLAFDLTALVSLALLIAVGEDNGGLKGFLMRPFAYLGRRTYGMYIFHWPVLALMVSQSIFFDTGKGVSLTGLFFAFSLVVFVSVFSYRFFEKPFLDLRKKYQYVKIG